MNEELFEINLEFNDDCDGDYKAKLDEVTSKLEKIAPYLTREQRKSLVGEITEAYVEQVGERPDGQILYRMGNVILREELTDKRKNKMSQSEYPIMSDRQKSSRKDGMRRRLKEGVVPREVPLKHASNVATDGVDYTLPIRSFRNPN